MRIAGRTVAACLLGSAVMAAAVPVVAAARQSPASAQGQRVRTDLSSGWRFRFGDAPDAVTAPDFDDGAWEKVSVPHTWNRIGAYGSARAPDADNRQGVGWYRLALDAPPAGPGMRQYLDFAAVGKIADVWVNGIHVGTHKGAFARFRIDVTPAWKPGARNLVVVRADNAKPDAGNASGQVIPLSGDFFVHGGIYREVSLLQLPGTSIDPLDHGGPGLYARSTQITAREAKVELRTRLRSDSAPRTLSLATRIVDARGKVVARAEGDVVVAPGAQEVVRQMAVPRPRLWNGRADPYLYMVTATLSDGGKVLDQVSQPLGLRTFRFDPKAGFFLNGRHVKLHGVSRHQDWLGSGWALTPAQHDRDMELIAELGANTVRQAHYQHADRWSDLADRTGMVVWAELPYVTTPSFTGGKGSEALWTNAEQQLREQIRQNYNHPSIMMWSVGNEVDSAKGFGLKGDPPRPLALLQHLNAVARQEDPDRPTTFADCCEGLGMMQTAGEKLAGTTDLIGYNRYFGWYYPRPLEAAAQLDAALDKLHGDHPQIPISITEYGAGGAITQHSDDVRGGFVNFIGRPHPEEYEAWVHEQSWPVLAARDFVFASWIWAMFDFGSDLREEGDAIDLNDKGLVTADRKERKDAFWYYKVAWSDAPAIHLAGKRYVDRSYPVMDVKAYANSPRATLSINGRRIGEAACTGFVCEWKGVPLAPGPNAATVSTAGGKRRMSDSAVWNGPDVDRQGLRIDVGSNAIRDLGGVRFGSDTFVTGGTPAVLNLAGFGGRSLGAPRKVDAASPALFDYWREGDRFSYAIPLPDGRWTVTLRLFEPRPGAAATAAVSVIANGVKVIDGLNVKHAAGAPLKELVRSFPVTVENGKLALDFVATDGKAALAAIELTR